ncbi:MAG: hypothetical protein ABI888_00635 [Chloroflexota bacterium]
MTDDQLGAALSDVGAHVVYPAAPDVRSRVLTRIATPRRTPWWRQLATPRYGYAPALVTLAVIALVTVFALSPDARATATDILRLRGVEIFRGPVPTPSPTRSPSSVRTPTPTVDNVTLGDEVTLDQARQRAGFVVVVPTDPAIGQPDAVYVRFLQNGVAVSFAYRVRDGIPVSAQAGLSALVTEFGGHLEPGILGKVVGQGTRIETLTVNGGAGAWLEGQPHEVFYTSGGGQFITDTLRLAGNTLIWEQGGIVMRLEAQVDKATALRIAASFR